MQHHHREKGKKREEGESNRKGQRVYYQIFQTVGLEPEFEIQIARNTTKSSLISVVVLGLDYLILQHSTKACDYLATLRTLGS